MHGPVNLVLGQSFFEGLKQGDLPFHQPFERFDGVLAFLSEAVNDLQVVAIKQTNFRSSADSELTLLSREAVRRDKEVNVVAELKTRFNGEANINWAEMLQPIGAQVVYRVVGLKTHAKMFAVTRCEGRHLVRYRRLLIGNHNPRAERLHSDVIYLTTEPSLAADIDNVFVHLASQSRLSKLHRLLLAPFQLQPKLVEKMDALRPAASQGKDTRIAVKMNPFLDEESMLALNRAGGCGVKMDLIVRSACMLPAQVPSVTDNIRVRSVIGRFLEHSRVFYFRYADTEKLYFSSADWISRNLLRRIELAWAVTDPMLRRRIVDECLVAYLLDGLDSWGLQADDNYVRVKSGESGSSHDAEAALMARYSARQ